MYKALHALTGEEIIILSPRWSRKIAQLKEMDQADLLVCQGCRQPLRVKAGEVKRPHFAHKHLAACSLGSESPEILNARAVLYHWLERQFGDAVAVEKSIPGAELPRTVDCWVEIDGNVFAYWLIEAGIKLEPREAIKAVFQLHPEIQVHWIFLKGMLHEKKEEFHSLLLTPTERAFLKTTPFDENSLGQAGASLHYLDADQETITTYRNLALFHRPNWFKGTRKASAMEATRAMRASGEILHSGELERLRTIREKQKKHEARLQRFQEREESWGRHLTERSNWLTDPVRRVERSQPAPEPAQALTCSICGKETSDYWSTFFDETGRKLCRCRECLDQSR